MTTVEALKAARELISDPAKWTRGAYARDAEGRELTNPKNERAVCWCAAGAVRRFAGDRRRATELVRWVVGYPGRVYGDTALIDLNDGGFGGEGKPRPAPARHRKVLAAFDRAIEAASK